jgi:hypothetical protein
MYILYVLLMFTVVTAGAAFAGITPTPELDAGTLSGLAAGFTGVYAAFRIYQAKRK